MLNHDKCPLCGSTEIKEKYNSIDHLVSGEQFPLIYCDSCSFVFTGTYPDEELSASYYQSQDYISHTDTENGLINRAYHKVRHYMLSRKLRMLKRKSGLNKGRVLDIGSGTGYFPAYLNSKGWECSGIEISEGARNFALENNEIRLLDPADINSIQDGSIDIITMWHTLEHFYQPDEYLNECFRILNNEGLLFIALPNHNSYDAQKYGADWAAWDVPRHLWHFNPDTISKMAQKHRFILTGTYRLAFDAFYVSVLSEKNRQSVFPVIRGFIQGSLSWMISNFSKSKTSSLVYVFRKDQ